MGWIDLIELRFSDKESLNEVKKDIYRLQNIADRFSKIGSKPILKEMSINKVIEQSIYYLKTRSSNKVIFSKNLNAESTVNANLILLEWVFENLIKNSIDAIKGDGNIIISTTKSNNKIAIDIEDNGRGIPKSKFKTIFDPGYTTKKRGWGLGLSLTKRIIEDYHKGKIFVKESELNKKTIFRIIL